MLAFGRPKGDRGSYRQWKEDGIAPQVVFEILSPGNRPAEMRRKWEFYERYGRASTARGARGAAEIGRGRTEIAAIGRQIAIARYRSRPALAFAKTGFSTKKERLQTAQLKF